MNLKDETLWLNANQMAKLFDRDVKTIRKHINNALMEELNNEMVVAKFATTTKHGSLENKTQTHMVEHYNLDMIISVGYRVKSKNGIIFRRWANKVLKDYLIKGYAINNKRLEYLEKTVKLVDIANRIDLELDNGEARKILKVIGEYSKALDLLDEYDHKNVKKVEGINSDRVITYQECLEIITKLKYNQTSNLFALERDNGLSSILAAIYQTFDGNDIYSSVIEKAANFLYMIVKNHVFIDGNKRIAATLFIYFLEYYNLLYKDGHKIIDNNTLTALTLLIAQSNPKEKKVLIDLIMNFLCE